MMRRALLTTIAVAAITTALTFTTPAIAGGGGCHGDANEATASMVELRMSCFTPTVTRVDPGQEVAFVNRDGFTHNIVGFAALWADIEGFGQGETRRFTFDEAGVFPYACTFHPGMVGAVVVGDDELHAGDAGTVAAASSSVPGGPGDATSAVGTRESAPEGSWLPEAVLALVLVTALIGGAALLVRRRVTRQRAIRSAI